MRTLTALAAALAALALPALADDDLTEALEARTFKDDAGKELKYRLFRPESVEEGEKYPLVLFLHGAGERGDDNAAQLKHGVPEFVKNQGDYPCFVAAPQCPKDSSWSRINRRDVTAEAAAEPAEPGRLALEMVEALEEEFPIDPDRVYITGLSMGGFGTWDLISRHPDRFAAAAPICGGGDPSKAETIKDVPIWAFHGAMDPVVRPQLSRDMVRALIEAGAHPGYTEYPDAGHDSWSAAYRDPELFRWLFSKTRKLEGKSE